MTLPRHAVSFLLLLTAGVSALVAAAPLSAQFNGRVGTTLVEHGADSAWNARVLESAHLARTKGPVERIVVVPLLVSSHSGHDDAPPRDVGDRAPRHAHC